MKNKEAKHILTASLKWLNGGANAINFLEVLEKADEAAQALETGARCLKRASELMDEAARCIREKGL